MPHTVLVVDDAHAVHELLEMHVADAAGLRVIHAFSAAEGARLFAEQQPDLILLDVGLPDMCGIELCRLLKSESAEGVPVLIVSGAGDTSTKIRGFEAGAVDYITKPFDVLELEARIQAALRTKRYMDLLSACAQIDALTGLRNRAFFERRIREEIDGVHRYGRQVGLVLLDLDRFKRLNDRYGHPFGDEVLRRLGETLNRGLRASDAACRYGGEEFALILPEVGLDGVRCVAERLRAQVGKLEFRHRGEVIRVTGSFGVGASEQFAGGGLTADYLVDAVDRALYVSKHSGRNRVSEVRSSAGDSGDLPWGPTCGSAADTVGDGLGW